MAQSANTRSLLFITSTNLASNPRCLKEMRLALDAGYKVSVIAFEMDNWTKDKESLIREELKDTVQFHYISATRKPIVPWLIYGLLERLCRRLFVMGLRSRRCVATGVNRRSAQISRLLAQKKLKADFIIAHNPGAFYPAAWWANRIGKPYAIDVEDFHPGEGNNPLVSKMQEFLLQQSLPNAAYVSYASEPIMRQTHQLFSTIQNPDHHFVINNVFAKEEFIFSREPASGPLQLFWFSQNVDAKRGLELVLPVLDQFSSQIKLNLLGNRRQQFYEEYLAHRSYVNCIGPVTQKELHRIAGQFDVGLAIEPGSDLNNTLLLSNKIWVYFQSGLYILATETEGNKSFVSRFPTHAAYVSLEPERFGEAMVNLLKNIESIRKEKENRWRNAQQHGWAAECLKIEKHWRRVLQL
mgnify:CR=1 FL=1